MTEDTERLGLPLLAVAQSQKEMTHNEALARIDILTQSVVEAVAPATIPDAPQTGQCWIVGPTPSGAWAGQAGALAGWTGGGWRFVAPFEGMSAWSAADRGTVRREGSAWRIASRQSPVADPAGGTLIDVEARNAITGILAALRINGQISR